jgi:hypothetical protein
LLIVNPGLPFKNRLPANPFKLSTAPVAFAVNPCEVIEIWLLNEYGEATNSTRGENSGLPETVIPSQYCLSNGIFKGCIDPRIASKTPFFVVKLCVSVQTEFPPDNASYNWNVIAYVESTYGSFAVISKSP